MDPTRYRIIYRGEVGLGYDHNEIRENISRLTRWDEKKIAQLLSSSYCIIKSDLDDAAAERMLNALNNTGIICRKEQVPATTPKGDSPTMAATIAVVGRPTVGVAESAVKCCPKCGVPQDNDLSCPACGIIFTKFAHAREAAASKPAVVPQTVSSHAVVLQRSTKRRNNPLTQFEEGHPLGYYLGKLLLVIALALLFRTLYNADLTLLILVLLPFGFALYLGALSAVTERPFGDLLAEHRSLLPTPFSDNEKRAVPLPFATYGLILLHVLLYLTFQLRTPIEILEKNWFFLPLDRSAENLAFSAFTSLFLHASGVAFIGGIFFLWIIGATLERRIGSLVVVGLYLFCGLLAAGIGVGVQQLFSGETLPIIGTGGAISGLIGVYAIRSHRRSMNFPLPFFGLDTLLAGTSYQVRWSSLLIAGLFVLADLGSPAAANDVGRGALGLMILLGGFLSGLLGASLLGLGNESEDEEDEPALGTAVFTANEGVLRKRLESNSDNPELLVQLARIIAAEELTDEARQLYRRAIIGRLTSKPKEAAEIYREFNTRYQEVFEPKLTLRLASLYQRQGDLGMTASVLHSICDDGRATPQEREKAQYQYSATMAKLGQIDEAHMMLTRYANEFPESLMLPKLRELIYDAVQEKQE